MCFSALRLNLNGKPNSTLRQSYFLMTPETYFIKLY
nr:MAG TPA: hypothetical protein [Caudoviricetes sp.]